MLQKQTGARAVKPQYKYVKVIRSHYSGSCTLVHPHYYIKAPAVERKKLLHDSIISIRVHLLNN